MSRKIVGAISLIALMLFFVLPIIAVRADTSIRHPRVVVYGTVTKDVYIGRSIWEYKDDQDLSSVLPFERQDKNITIQFSNIVFDKGFENKSVAKGTDHVYAGFSLTKEVIVSNGVEEVYLKAENSSSLTSDTAYQTRTQLNVEKTVTNDYYLLVTAKISKTADNIVRWEAYVWFGFIDSGATERTIQIFIAGESDQDSITKTATELIYRTYGHTGYYTIQFKIGDLLEAAGLSWNLVKLKTITYGILLKTGSTLDTSTIVEARFRHALVLPGKVYIDDGTANGLIINGTSGQFPYCLLYTSPSPRDRG